MFTPNDPPRQIATPQDNQIDQPDINNYTYSVRDAVLAFREASMSITDRTIQRYCQSSKLRALRVDPDTRQPTDKDNYLFLIDPTSIPERVAQLREKQEFVSPTVIAASRDITRPVATSHDWPEAVAPAEDTPKTERQTQEEIDELKQLREKVMSLEIDKRVRDGLLDQMKDDRKELLSQLQNHVETMTSQSRVIGQLETRLELSAPLPQPHTNDTGATLPTEDEQPIVRHEGDNDANHHTQYGV
ncbi:MAG: hypothetical protein GY761_18270 [Hyphomicrobiales bacterium]|nr:hypothetical protein [Hyphomicrobiales bacterium]